MKRWYLFLLMLLPSCWQPWKTDDVLDEIVEIKNITDVYNYIDNNEYNQDTLVMFDLDNTILSPATDLGSDQWFYALYKRKVDEGMEKQDAINAIMPVYKQVVHNVIFEQIEPETVSVIHTLQKKGLTVIGFTARALHLIYPTIEHLNHIGVSFDQSDPHECPIKYGVGEPAVYVNGTIFTGKYSKGEVLAAWLKQIDYQPKKVIFVDDKLKNIKSVEQSLHKRNFPFIGLRYSFLDERVKQFDWDTTQKEFEQFLQQHPESRPIPVG